LRAPGKLLDPAATPNTNQIKSKRTGATRAAVQFRL
jgi:hypothetical protein